MAHQPLSVASDDYPAAVVSAGLLERVPPSPRKWSRWPVRILLLFVCFWVGDAGISLLIQHTGLRGKLTSRLALAFGRPVQVDRYDFSLWTGPSLEAQSVTVGEDPRFGHEYFMRAESLQVRLRWQSLLRGHLGLGTLSLTRPSLNIVRNANGDWNLAEWLPRPATRSSQGSSNAPDSGLRFQRIDVDGGRINFKRSDEKLPFAFVGVEGTVETDVPGRWRLDLKATPWRASILTQQSGTIHVSGRVGGTSSRLLPAALDAAWTDASVSDVLRLAQGDDYGIRGNLGLIVSANTEGADWNVQGRAEIRQLHRWDLALRADNPSVNFLARMKFDPQATGLELTQGTLEAPHSNVHGSGKILWSGAGSVQKNGPSPLAIKLSDSAIDLNDILAWVRAFHGGVADDVSIHGLAAVMGAVSGWPLRLENAEVVTPGADLAGQGVRVPVHLGPTEFHYDQGQVSFLPVIISFGSPKGPSSGSLRVDASLKDTPKRPSYLRLAGSLTQVRDLTAMAGMLGWNLSRGWDVAGPFRCDLRWQGTRKPWLVEPVGFIELGGADDSGGVSLRAPFLNYSIEGIKARADLKPGIRRIALSSAEAFGARWNGTFDRRSLGEGWQFSLSADQLASADIDLWLNPRWRQSFLDRMLPFLNSRGDENAVPENLRASGHLGVSRFTLSPLVFHDFQGDVSVAGRHIEVTNASSQFYGGEVNGSVDAELNAVPSYRADANFSGVDLSSITEASPQIAAIFGGSASGDVSFIARGATHADLVASLECEGSAAVQTPELRNINLFASLQDVTARVGTSLFRQASATFSCRDDRIEFHSLSLLGPEGEIDGTGSVDFSRAMDFQLRIQPGSEPGDASRGANSSVGSSRIYQLTGPLASPQLTPVASSAHRAR